MPNERLMETTSTTDSFLSGLEILESGSNTSNKFRSAKIFPIFLKILHQAFQESILAHCFRVTDDTALSPGTGHGHVHSSSLAQETHL